MFIKSVEEPTYNLNFLYMGLPLYRSKPHNTRISPVYFMYKSRVLKAEPVDILEKPGTEKPKIHKHNK